jgi:multiple sugar transport system ATP-binding protein
VTPIELRKVSKMFGTHVVCRDVDFSVAPGEFVTLLGPSGCGKTTTLNMLAGLEDCSSGDIMMGGRRVNDLSPVERDVAMVFQNYALYPHMTVAENIGFTLKMRRLAKAEIRNRVKRVAASLELSQLLERLPSQLSGGQQQRVAIGRALVREPKIFLFDEPFSNLDASLRVRMRSEIKELHQRLKVTSIFVTHDQEEAMSISDRIAVMNQGRVEQFDTPEEIYARPANRYVAGFIGSPRMDLAEGLIIEVGSELACRIGSDILNLPDDRSRFTPGRIVEIGARPEHVQLGEGPITASVRHVQSVGPATHVALDWQGTTLTAAVPGFARFAAGSSVSAAIDPENLLVFDHETGERILLQR